jgi:hypothetical protein
MLGLPNGAKIYFHLPPTDMRNYAVVAVMLS